MDSVPIWYPQSSFSYRRTFDAKLTDCNFVGGDMPSVVGSYKPSQGRMIVVGQVKCHVTPRSYRGSTLLASDTNGGRLGRNDRGHTKRILLPPTRRYRLQCFGVRLAVLVPVKRFSAAKGRLAGVLTDADRARLAEWLATRVLTVVDEIPTFVACDDEHVATWAKLHGAKVLWSRGLGLNGAVDDGIRQISGLGFEHITVSHADLARPAALPTVARQGCVTLVPDRRRDGTNVMSFPTKSALSASYGGGSFSRHLQQAQAIDNVELEIRTDPDLSLDVDTAHDLAHPLISEVLPEWLPTTPVNPSHR